jgi:cysteine desulfurase NifS/selenium donor protein
MKTIYLDYNATTPIDPRVAQAMLPFVHEHFGNPSSGHAFGVAAKKAVEKARSQVAGFLGCGVDEVIFTSGGSEANNYAIRGAAEAYRRKGNHVVTTAVEHPAVIEVCRYLERIGWNVTYVPVDETGLVDARDVEAAITPQTILVSVMHANNEVGTIEPVREIADIAHRHGVLVHTDCAQSTGKIPVHANDLGVDLLSVAGHKLYAPKGIGVLYVRTGVALEKLIHGAQHEMNRRAGTENVTGIVGLGEACEIAGTDIEKHGEHMRRMRDRLEKGLLQKFPWVRVNGHAEKRLPNTTSVSFRGLEANTILSELAGVAASAGAACHADGIELSSVLQAMRVPLEYAMGTVRFSTGRFTTADEIDRALDEIVEVVAKLAPAEAPVRLSMDSGEVKLTQYTHGLGCACKLRPQLLEQVLKNMPVPNDERILVGAETSDDAAVFKIDDRIAIVQTVDFFTPIVDDPFQFGAISAANSLSDIYAMGGKPLFALNIVGFPSNRLPIGVLEAILNGAQSKAEEAGISIIGGHTVDDTEPKFGLAVTGSVDPGRVVTNKGARPGDALVLTKPIGTGILSTALKRGLLEPAQEKILIDTMAALNKTASEAMQEIGVNACTDVTGFGLVGHATEMAAASRVTLRINAAAVPLLTGVRELAKGNRPGGLASNLDHFERGVSAAAGIDADLLWLLYDPQTSGGLLIAAAPEHAAEVDRALMRAGVAAASIGTAAAPGPHHIELS